MTEEKDQSRQKIETKDKSRKEELSEDSLESMLKE
jgi:hypothetical protein